MISVEKALTHIFSLLNPTGHEEVPLAEATGRVLAQPVRAGRDQPPFSASSMDGYAIRTGDLKTGAVLPVVGISAAGDRFAGTVDPGQAVRIYTGAPVPDGADHVVIQENVSRQGAADQAGGTITINDTGSPGDNIRPAGGDFRVGDVIDAPRRLTPADLTLIAAMNHARVTVHKRPVVALLATGDELVMPGENPGPDQIIASNSFGIRSVLQAQGAECRLLPIARDNAESLSAAFRLAQDADLLVTSGGASVGDRDLVAPVAREHGLDLSFYKVAMRPGKPLMAGSMAGMTMIGLPGNPVSSMVCTHVFLRPSVDAMLGLPARALSRQRMATAGPIAANGGREHYMRGHLGEDGCVHVADRQDSSLMSVLSRSNCLVVRRPNAPAASPGDLVDVIPV